MTLRVAPPSHSAARRSLSKGVRLRSVALLLLPFVAACAAVPQGQSIPSPTPQPVRTPPPQPLQRATFQAPQIMRIAGLEGVIEQDAAALLRRFGSPRLDVREDDVRKLQFAGPACLLDIFLYPLRPGAKPVSTHIEARRASDGQDVDRAACIAALSR